MALSLHKADHEAIHHLIDPRISVSPMVYHNDTVPGQHKILTQSYVNVGQTSKNVGQHSNNIGLTSYLHLVHFTSSIHMYTKSPSSSARLAIPEVVDRPC